MNKSRTQFIVAVMGMFFLGAATLAAVLAEAFFDSANELTFALVTALTGTTSAAAAYLFRLNGQSNSK